MFNAKKVEGALVCVSILYIIFGLILLIWPQTTGLLICYLVGAITLVHGIFRLVGYFMKEDMGILHQFDFALGLFDVFMGMILLLCAPSVLLILPIFIGFSILVDAVARMQAAHALQALGYRHWKAQLALAIIMIFAGMFLVVSPFYISTSLMLYIGISMLIDGIVSLISILWINRAYQKMQ